MGYVIIYNKLHTLHTFAHSMPLNTSQSCRHATIDDILRLIHTSKLRVIIIRTSKSTNFKHVDKKFIA